MKSVTKNNSGFCHSPCPRNGASQNNKMFSAVSLFSPQSPMEVKLGAVVG